ncbi:VWA domain-containing protein [Nocardioides sp.]|uniref:VWA domain-containing protein n=1 Tax=Nocardioides sp. TaxID=35761 RepID=UPI0039E65AE3
MTFAWPLALLALLLVPLLFAVAWWSRRRRRRAAIRVTSVALVRSALPRHSSWRRRLPPALLALGLLVLAVGAARPQVSVPVPVNGTTIVLAMDVSQSMCSTDVDPNRLTVAQDAALDFLDDQPAGVRIGLVTFAGTAGLLVPPTDDLDEVRDAIEGFQVSRGTAVGSAILTSLDAISEVDPSVAPSGVEVDGTAPSYVPHVVVVLTDGATTQGVDPALAAQAAAARGVRVFTIGFGTTNPSVGVCDSSQLDGDDPGFGGGFGGGDGGRGGNPLVVDEEALTQIAETTGATYYQAESADELSDALADLPSTLSVVREDRDVAAWLAAAGGLLIAVATGLSLWFGRVR